MRYMVFMLCFASIFYGDSYGIDCENVSLEHLLVMMWLQGFDLLSLFSFVIF